MKKFLARFHSNEKGFTLVELLVVIAILGILAAVAIPNITKFIGQSKIAAANAELGMVRTAVAADMADNGVSVLTTPFILSSSADVTPAADTYIQGGKAVLVGSYTFNAQGVVTAATYTGGGTFSAATGKFA